MTTPPPPRLLAVATAATLLPAMLALTPAVAKEPAVTCGGQNPTVTGTAGNDELVGTAGDDVIVGLDGHDTIDGLGGNDLICGGPRIDTIDAGPGDDEVWGGADGWYRGREGDWILGGPGDDQLHGGTDPNEAAGLDKHEDIVAYATATQGIAITLGQPTVTGQGTDMIDGFYSVVGSDHDDVIAAGAETDVVRALGGDDQITVDSDEGEVFGGSGDDDLTLGHAVYGGKGMDTVVRATKYADGGPGRDRMVGTMSRDSFRGGTGADVLRGRGGADYLDGTKGRNKIVGGAAADWVRGGNSSDLLIGGPGSDLIEPGDYVTDRTARSRPSDDQVLGGGGDDTVSYPEVYRTKGVRIDLAKNVATRVGRDVLRGIENARGGTGGDVIIGDRGSNMLAGGEGDDRLYGRGGADQLTMAFTDGEGPSGSDVFRGGPGQDLVDYYLSNVAQGVVLDLARGTSTGQGADTLGSIERVRGTVMGDRLRGDGKANTLMGGPGDDVIVGRGGTDSARGGSGVDTCDAEQMAACEG